MFVEDFPHKRALIERLLAEAPAARTGSLDHVVRRALERRGEMLALAERRATPCYVFDEGAFEAALAAFSGAFSLHVPRHRPFYAVKSNHHSLVVRAAVRAGFGLDVSSGRELVQALRGKAERILFSGPAKSEADLELAVQHTRRVVVNLDSFREPPVSASTPAITARGPSSASRWRSCPGSGARPAGTQGSFWRVSNRT
jgi:diaminopimelate decarboxylase